MRYLLIDTQHENFSGKGSGVLLSEESAMEVFKEIFIDGYHTGVEHGRMDLSDSKDAWSNNDMRHKL